MARPSSSVIGGPTCAADRAGAEAERGQFERGAAGAAGLDLHDILPARTRVDRGRAPLGARRWPADARGKGRFAGAAARPKLAVRPAPSGTLPMFAIHAHVRRGSRPRRRAGRRRAPGSRPRRRAGFRAADPGGFSMGFVDGVPATAISASPPMTPVSAFAASRRRPESRPRGFDGRSWLEGRHRPARHARHRARRASWRNSDTTAAPASALAHRNIRFGGVVAADALDDPRLVPVGPAHVEAISRAMMPAASRPGAPPFSMPGSTAAAGGRRSLSSRTDGCAATASCGRRSRASRSGRSSPTAPQRPTFSSARSPPRPAARRSSSMSPSRTARRSARRTIRHAAGFRDGAHDRGAAPELLLERIFGITSFELG